MITILAQQNHPEAAAGLAGLFGGGLCCCGLPILLLLGFLVVTIMGWWKLFIKAGKPGWAALVPVYNVVVLAQIAGRPEWWAVLFFIPIANLVVMVILGMDVAKRFGRGDGFGVGLGLLPWIFYPILGFSESKYTPPTPTP